MPLLLYFAGVPGSAITIAMTTAHAPTTGPHHCIGIQNNECDCRKTTLEPSAGSINTRPGDEFHLVPSLHTTRAETTPPSASATAAGRLEPEPPSAGGIAAPIATNAAQMAAGISSASIPQPRQITKKNIVPRATIRRRRPPSIGGRSATVEEKVMRITRDRVNCVFLSRRGAVE